MTRVPRILFAAGLLVAAYTSATAQQCRPAEAVTSFGRWFEPAVSLTSSSSLQKIDSGITDIQVASLKLLVGVASGTDRDWNLVIRDLNYHVLATFGASDFADNSSGLTRKRWTGRLPAGVVRADLVARHPSDMHIDIIAGVAFPNESSDQRLFSIQGPQPAWQDLYESDSIAARRAGDSVGMLVTQQFSPDTGWEASWCCTGVMVARDIMLTNWHCGGSTGIPANSYWNSDVCANALIDLAWDNGHVARQYNCVEVLARDQGLDFALIRIQPVVGMGAGSGEPVHVQLMDAVSATDVFVVHHALCKPKLVSSHCQIRATAYENWLDPTKQTDVTHNCDTEPGASGAPVFDMSGQLVGLHHLGFKRNEQCVAVDQLDKAVRIGAIIGYIKDQKPVLLGELHLR
jgi:hypothetical protein